MGKCLSCLKVSPPAHHQNLPQYPSVQHAAPWTEYERTRGTELRGNNEEHRPQPAPAILKRLIKEVSESGSSASGVEGYTPVQPPDAQSNGSGKNSVIVSASEKRSFYSRIPPLVKSASNEVRRLSSKDYSETKISVLFDQYKDIHSDVILSEGIERLCLDLDVRPEEFKVLVLAWKFGAETMCRFSRREFVSGCKALRVDSVKGIQSKFPDMLLEVQEPEKFKDLYRFTFKFGLDAETGQRMLPADMAVLLWKLVFTQQEPAILKRWLMFLELHPNIRGVPRDTWNMFLNFTEAVGDDLSSYDDTEAWPSLFDDFVEFENDQLNQNVTKDLRDESD